MHKMAILGGGSMGVTHAMAYESIPGDFRVTAVSDAREENVRALAARFGAVSYPSSDELLERFDGDIVDICLPTPLHKDTVLKSLAKGMHVFCEKPLALTLDDAREVLAACRTTDRKVMVGHCIRFWPEYLALKEIIDNRSLGSLTSIVFKRIASKRKPGLAWKEWIFDEKQSGSAVIDLHIHDVDYLRFILGEPDRIQALLYNNKGRAEHIFSSFVYGSVVANTEASWAYPTGSVPFLMAFTALFEKGVVTFSSAEKPSLKVFREDTGAWSAPPVAYPVVRSTGSGGNVPSIAGYVNELAYFLKCIENDTAVEVGSVEESVKSLELTIRTAEIAYRAYRGEENLG
jgi:predicted dehydrogenase